MNGLDGVFLSGFSYIKINILFYLIDFIGFCFYWISF